MFEFSLGTILMGFGVGFGYGIDCTMTLTKGRGLSCLIRAWRGCYLGVLALALAVVFVSWFYGCGLFLVLSWWWVLSKGVVYPVTVSGLIVYIYPHAIGLLVLSFFL